MTARSARLREVVSRWLPRDGFGRQVAIMGGGTALVQAVGIVASPILTRLYGPADFGVMAAFQAVAEIIILIATLRFDVAIPVVPSNEAATKLLVLAGTCAASVSALVLVLAAVLPASAFEMLSADVRFYSFRWFLVVAVLGGAWYNCLVGWVTRCQHFLLLSSSRAYQSLSSVAVQLGAGGLGLGIIGLIVGAVTNLTSGIWMLWRKTIRDLGELKVVSPWSDLGATALAHRKYPTFTLGTAFLNLLGRSAPTLVISAFYGSTATGLFGLGLRVIGLPSALISTAVSSVFLSRLPEATRNGQLASLMGGVTARLSAISAYMFCVLVGFGPELFGMVFGEKWVLAGQYVRLLSPWLYLMFIFSPQTSIVLATGRQAADAIWQIPILGLRILALYVGTRMGGEEVAIALFGAVSAATAVVYFAWVLRLGGGSLRRIGSRLAMDLVPIAAVVLAGRLLYVLAGEATWVMMLSVFLPGAMLWRRFLAAWNGDDLRVG